MFHFDSFQYQVNDEGLVETQIDSLSIPPGIMSVLDLFEQQVYSKLENCRAFKYVQGETNGAILFNLCKSEVDLGGDNIYLFSNHPNYIGSDLINDHFTSFKQKNTYCVFVSGAMGKAWMNSKINKGHLIEMVKAIYEVFSLSEPIKFRTIELYASTEFEFQIANQGMKNPLWKIKKI